MATKYKKKVKEEVVEDVQSMTNQDENFTNQDGSFTNSEGDYVFSRAAGGSNSPAAAKYTSTIPQPLGKQASSLGESASPAAADISSPAAAESSLTIPQPQGKSNPPAAAESFPHPLGAPAAGEITLGELIAYYNYHLSSGVDNVTRIYHYQGLQGLASSHYKLPQLLRDIIKLPDQLRTQYQSNALAAYGHMIITGAI